MNATIADGVGVGSILNRQTKFFVVDGGTPKTNQYGSSGTSEELTIPEFTSNTAPRGVATTTAGTTVWVVDANKTVYVYTNHSVLLGSWTAGGMPPNAAVEGIATNGADIWLLANSNSKDKVYKYTGAAGRRSQSQSADRSFRLANGNTTPKDIVTDGSSIWIVDDGAMTDKVFKYTDTGSSLGSWTIDPASAHPTGITINPANVSDIWIVDNSTLKVYQYVGAASRTSGSQNAAATFALNPYDTNPQGIADPPPPEMILTPAIAPLSLQPSDVAFNAVPLVGPSTVSGVPALATQDTVFALLVREALPRPGEPSIEVLGSSALPSRLDRPIPFVDRAWTLAYAPGGQLPLAPLTPLLPGSSQGIRSQRSTVGLPDSTLAEQDSQGSGAATNFFSAGLAHDGRAGGVKTSLGLTRDGSERQTRPRSVEAPTRGSPGASALSLLCSGPSPLSLLSLRR